MSGEDGVEGVCESAMVGFLKIEGQERETNLTKNNRPFEGVRGPGTCQALYPTATSVGLTAHMCNRRGSRTDRAGAASPRRSRRPDDANS